MRIFLSVFCLFIWSLYGDAQDTIFISEKSGNIAIEKYAQVFKTDIDSIDILTIKEEQWHAPKTGLNFGMVNKIHWIKIRVKNTAKEFVKLNLYTPYHHIRSLQIFQYKSTNKLIKLSDEGTLKQYNKKEKLTPGYSTSISFPTGVSHVYIRIKHINIPLRANSYLLKDKQLEKVIQKSNTNYDIWRIIMMLAFFISLIAYIITKVRLFLLYLFLNSGVLLFIGMETGLFFLCFNQDYWFSIIDIKHLGDIIVLIAFPYFLNELTPIKKHNSKLWRWTMILWVIAPVTWAIGLIPALKETSYFYYSVWYLIILTIYIFFIQLYFLIVAFRKKEKNSLLLFGLYMLYITAVTLEVILPNLGMKSDEIYVYDVLLKSSIIEVIAFFGLIVREIYTIFKDRNSLLVEQKELKEEMLHAVIKSQEEERNILGRELHDMIGANMSVVRQNTPKENLGLIKIIDETIDSVRSLSHGLMTPRVKGNQLKNEIIDLCISCTTDKFKVNHYFHKWKPILNEEDSTHFYRIIQELLQNAVKHSKANEIFIQIIVKNQNLKLSYEDNGVGFDVSKKGKGLLGIAHRAEIIQAEMRFDSSPGGTFIELELERS